MAITADLRTATPYSLVYLLTHDGAAGDALVLANATLQGDAIGGPLARLLNTAIADQAGARRNLLGDLDADPDAANDFAISEARVRTGQSIVELDADVDGVTATLPELNIAMTTAVAATALLTIRFQHSYDR